MVTSAQQETVAWSTMKTVQTRDGFDIYYVELDAGSKTYDVYGTNHIYFLHSYVTDANSGTDGTDFETNYKSAGVSVPSQSDALVLTMPPINSLGTPQVEIVSRTGNTSFNQYTITSHNWCRKTTWFQNYDSWTDESMVPDVGGVYTTYKLNDPADGSYLKETWINIDDFTNTMQEYARNAPPYGRVAVWERDGTMSSKDDWRPVIKVNGTTQTSGYTIDYATGKVTFDSTLQSDDTVTATFRSPKVSGGTEFILRPRPGKKLSIPHTEINLTEDCIITGTVVFEVWAGTPDWLMIQGYEPYYLQYKMEYQSMHQIFGLSVVGGDVYPAIGGLDSVTASAKTGWSTNQKRGTSSPLREIPYDFGVAAGWGKSIVLRSDQFAQIRAYIQGDTQLGGEYCSLSLYVEEDDL